MVEFDEPQKTEIKAFLTSVLLPANKKELKKKLVETKDYRKSLIALDFDEYMTMWNFYFACPELVRIFFYFFLIRFYVS